MNTQIIYHPFDKKFGSYFRHVFIEAKIVEGKFSMHGVEGPRSSGECYGSCGQIRDSLREALCGKYDIRYTEGWNKLQLGLFLNVWETWHLNNLHAGCEHQRALGWEEDGYDLHPSESCPECGHRFGTEWQTIPLPDNILEILAQFPVSKLKPAWV